MMQTWLGFPFVFAMTTGVLQAIPDDLYEAATMDGASAFTRLRTITLPLVLYAIAPIIIAPPLGISIVDSARRTRMPGIVMGCVVMRLPSFVRTVLPGRTSAFSDVSSLTSDETFRLMRPSLRTTGVKARPTPKGLNSIETLPLSSEPVGTGNWPPAMKFAVSPDRAVRFGSASSFITLARSSARNVPARLL